MGIFNTIKHWQIKSFVRGACRSMLVSFHAFKHQAEEGKIEAGLFSDLAAKALSTRPKWKLISENTFERTTGERIEIKKEDTLADVVLSVILIETKEFILNDNDPGEILGTILVEFRKFFSIATDSDMDKIYKKNQEFSKILGAVTLASVHKSGLR